MEKVNIKHLFYERYEKQLETLNKLKLNKYSKISQTLFWEIEKRINYADGDLYFYELNNEYFLKIDNKFNYKSNIIFLDFKYQNKIIEYNGNYWHNHENDKIRYEILKKMGYDVLVITSDEYNRNKKTESTINKCIKFLQQCN